MFEPSLVRDDTQDAFVCFAYCVAIIWKNGQQKRKKKSPFIQDAFVRVEFGRGYDMIPRVALCVLHISFSLFFFFNGEIHSHQNF